jgi:hypothetical protein
MRQPGKKLVQPAGIGKDRHRHIVGTADGAPVTAGQLQQERFHFSGLGAGPEI